MRTPHKVLYAKERTLQLILTNHHPIQIDDEPPTTNHWSAHNESCQLENLNKQNQCFPKNDRKTLPHWSRYILQTDADEHGNQPANSKTTGHQLCQGSFSLKTAPAVVA